MCGRYVARRETDDLVVEFEASDLTGEDVVEADWNVAPTKPVPVVLTRHAPGDRGGPVFRQVRVARWGLVPSWSADLTPNGRMINARVETVTQLPAFRAAVARRRCLVPADGWYEWAKRDGAPGRQPYFLGPRDGGLVAFAGLYEITGEAKLLTSSIITTAAVGELTRVHDRMPLMLPRSAWAAWLDPGRTDPTELLSPPAHVLDALVGRIELRQVGPAVGNVANNGPQLVAPAAVAEPQTLF